MLRGGDLDLSDGGHDGALIHLHARVVPAPPDPQSPAVTAASARRRWCPRPAAHVLRSVAHLQLPQLSPTERVEQDMARCGEVVLQLGDEVDQRVERLADVVALDNIVGVAQPGQRCDIPPGVPGSATKARLARRETARTTDCDTWLAVAVGRTAHWTAEPTASPSRCA